MFKLAAPNCDTCGKRAHAVRLAPVFAGIREEGTHGHAPCFAYDDFFVTLDARPVTTTGADVFVVCPDLHEWRTEMIDQDDFEDGRGDRGGGCGDSGVDEYEDPEVECSLCGHPSPVCRRVPGPPSLIKVICQACGATVELAEAPAVTER